LEDGMAEISDEELMMEYQQGDVHAFELLFEKYRRPVFNFLYRMLSRQRDAAEDLLQEVFMKLLKAKDFYEPRAKFSTWLFAITRNHCINYLKSRRYAEGAASLSLEAEPRGTGTPLADRLPASETGFSAVARHELQTELERAIGELPDVYKEAFLLHAVEGFSHEEAARILELNPATVRTRFHRARAMLKDRMRALLSPEGDSP
jgi:RNA polymerase sigma-70 factor (ECF subfamily)